VDTSSNFCPDVSRARRNWAPQAADGGEPGHVEAVVLDIIERLGDVVGDPARVGRRVGEVRVPRRGRGRDDRLRPARGLVGPGEHGLVELDRDRLRERFANLGPDREAGVVNHGIGHGHDRGDLLGDQLGVGPGEFGRLLQAGVAADPVRLRERREHRLAEHLARHPHAAAELQRRRLLGDELDDLGRSLGRAGSVRRPRCGRSSCHRRTFGPPSTW
jgi:hypothetical protein